MDCIIQDLKVSFSYPKKIQLPLMPHNDLIFVFCNFALGFKRESNVLNKMVLCELDSKAM